MSSPCSFGNGLKRNFGSGFKLDSGRVGYVADDELSL
jgi:hypothetical protein